LPQAHPFMAVRQERPRSPRGNPVLLVHGFMSRADIDWPRERWIEPMLDQGRTVVTVDLPGHGEAARVERAEDVRTAKLVTHLARALEETGAPFDVIGYSLGARLAWALASQHPPLVSKLVLGGLSPMDPFAALDFAAARRFIDAGTVPADPMTAFIVQMVAQATPDPHSMFNLAEGLAAEPFAPAAESPRASTLFAAGTDDPMAGGIAVLEAHVPGSRTVRVPGDHMGALASPEFRREAFGFLGLTA